MSGAGFQYFHGHNFKVSIFFTVQSANEEGFDPTNRITYSQLVDLLDYGNANKINVLCDEYVKLKRIQSDAQFFSKKIAPFLYLMHPIEEIESEKKEDIDGFEFSFSSKAESKNKHSKAVSRNNRFTINEVDELFDELSHIECKIAEFDQVRSFYDQVKTIESKISSVNDESVSKLTSLEIEDLLHAAASFEHIVDFGFDLKQVKIIKQTREWLDKYEVLFSKPTERSITIENAEELRSDALRIPSFNTEVSEGTSRLDRMIKLAIKWTNNVFNKLKLDGNGQFVPTEKPIPSFDMPSYEYLEKMLSIADDSADLSIMNLNPFYETLKDVLTQAKEWNQMSHKLMIQSQKALPVDKWTSLYQIEQLVETGRKIRCRLNLDPFEATVEAVHLWKNDLAKLFELTDLRFYRLLDIILPKSGIKSLENNYSSRNHYLYLTRRKNDKKDHTFFQQVKSNSSVADIHAQFNHYLAREDSIVEALRQKHSDRRAYMEWSNLASSSSDDKTTDADLTSNSTKPPLSGKLCYCGREFSDDLIECQLCLQWFHKNCTNSSQDEPAVKKSSRSTNQYGLFLCCLCTRSRRPKIKDIEAFNVTLKKLPVFFVEGEVFRCYVGRVHTWINLVKTEMKKYSTLHALYLKLCKVKGDKELKLSDSGETLPFESTPFKLFFFSKTDKNVGDEALQFLNKIISDALLLEIDFDEFSLLWRLRVLIQ